MGSIVGMECIVGIKVGGLGVGRGEGMGMGMGMGMGTIRNLAF